MTMRSHRLFFIVLFIFICFKTDFVNAQFDDIDFRSGDYRIKTKYDTSAYSTVLKVYYDGDQIFKANYEQYVTGVKEYDLNSDGKKEIFIEAYSGGAHCCFTLYTGKFSNGKFILTDSLFLGNGYYEVKDLDNNGKFELECSNDMFAYAFTNYAETKFPTMIYKFENGKLIEATSDYKTVIRKELDIFLEELKEITVNGFKCEEDGEETFNTEAGSVKTVLAAIVADYYSLGEVQKGYDLVDSVYKCPDRDKYKLILQNDFKLK